MDTGEVRQLERAWNVPDIERWFFDLLDEAQRWLRWRYLHDEARARVLSSLMFPLTPRKGQQDIMDSVTSAIQEGDRLYAQAPTGSGKTIATLYPALKAMGENEISRIAFLTAKTMTRQAALECLDLLGRQGTATNALVMTARDKICPLVRGAQASQIRSRPLTTLCNPVECPLARGHYNAVNDALFELIEGREVIDAEYVTQVAARHHVCPYELQRDAARWADLIICDYHYAFAPSASLMGTSDEAGTGDTVFLVDEVPADCVELADEPEDEESDDE
jgi:Rad3-related DNA helicase